MNSTARPWGARHWDTNRAWLLASALVLVGIVAIVPPLYLGLGACLILLAAAILRYPITGFCALAFSVPWASGQTVPVGGFPVTLTEVIVALLAGVWLVVCLEQGRRPLRDAVWFPYLGIFIVAISLSTVVAVDSHASLREVTKWIEVAIIYLSATLFVRTERDVEWIVGALVAAGVSQAAFGFAQLGLYLGPAAFARVGGLLRAYGTFDQPNPYAGYLNMILPLALAMTVMHSGARRRVYGTATVILGGGLLASESRGALLAAAAALVVMGVAWSARCRQGTTIVALLAAIFAWLANFGLVPLGPFQKVLTAVGLSDVSFGVVNDTNFSAVERAAHWLAGVRMFAAHPLLGVGIGNYDAAYPAYHPRGWYASLQHAHNYYINIAAEAGIIGLTAYALLVCSALWYSLAAMQRARQRVYCALGLGVLGTLVTVSVHNIFDVLYVHGLTALLGLMMALISVAIRNGAVPQASAAESGSSEQSK